MIGIVGYFKRFLGGPGAENIFDYLAPRISCFRKNEISALVKTESYPIEDGRLGKLSRETSP